MPLPPAPAKRAALLTQTSFDNPVRPAPRPARRAASDEGHPLARQAPANEPVVRPLVDDQPAHGDGPEARNWRTKPGRSPSEAPAIAEAGAPAAGKGSAKTRRPKPTGPTKLFVLDTNVLMHDPMCLFRFEEHDIFLPMIVLEELDGHKKA